MRKIKRKLIFGSIIACLVVILLFIISIVSMYSAVLSNEDSNNSSSFSPQTEVQINALALYNRALLEGGNSNSACALAGVVQHESGIIPSTIQSNLPYNEVWATNPTMGGYGIGLAQWDSGRRVNLINYAKSVGKSWQDLDVQLDFMFNHDGTDSTLLKTIIKENSIETVVTRLTKEWERAGVAAIENRLTFAQAWYALIVENNGGQDIGQDIGVSSEAIPSGYENKVYPKPSNLSYSGNFYPVGQCTWGAYDRVHEFGASFPWISGNAGNGGMWYTVSESMGYKTVKGTPSEHWIVSFPPGVGGADPTYGHVAVVEVLNSDGSFLISETNSGTPASTRRWRVVSASMAQYLYFINPNQ